MGTNTFNSHLLSPYLSGFGISGAVALLVATGNGSQFLGHSGCLGMGLPASGI